MATPLPERAAKENRGPQRTWPEFRDVPERAEEAAKHILGTATAESLKPAFDENEEDTGVIRGVLVSQRAEIERLCREFVEADK